jgi:hypothetical protein
LPIQIGVAALVASASGMLPAIDFNDEPRGKADEIGYVEIDRNLPPELASREPMRPQYLP